MPEHIVRNMAAAVISILLWIKQLEISKQNLIEANITYFKKKKKMNAAQKSRCISRTKTWAI